MDKFYFCGGNQPYGSVGYNGFEVLVDFKHLCPLKFIYSEKAAKFRKIFPLLLSYVVPVKSKGKISQNLRPSQNIWTLLKTKLED